MRLLTWHRGPATFLAVTEAPSFDLDDDLATVPRLVHTNAKLPLPRGIGSRRIFLDSVGVVVEEVVVTTLLIQLKSRTEGTRGPADTNWPGVKHFGPFLGLG